MKNSDKIILDLCGGTGSWSNPYKDAGYDVRLVTLPDLDVCALANIEQREWKGYRAIWDKIRRHEIYGILAAPPCTMFSFARTNAKKPRDLQEGMQCVRACFDIVWECMEVQQPTAKKELPLKFWALENPYHGFLKKFLGTPAFTFDPWEFGNGYQKRTALWGHFNEPIKNPVELTPEMKELAKTNSYLHKIKYPVAGRDDERIKFDYLKSKDIHPEAFGKFDRQTRRSITPAGFAKAFFDSNR
jgi:hypothetical protein